VLSKLRSSVQVGRQSRQNMVLANAYAAFNSLSSKNPHICFGIRSANYKVCFLGEKEKMGVRAVSQDSLLGGGLSDKRQAQCPMCARGRGRSVGNSQTAIAIAKGRSGRGVAQSCTCNGYDAVECGLVRAGGGLMRVSASLAPVIIDIHGLFVKEAIELVSSIIEYYQQEVVEGRARATGNCSSAIRLIVGKGIHSAGGKAKLGPAVARYLGTCGILCTETEGEVSFRIAGGRR